MRPIPKATLINKVNTSNHRVVSVVVLLPWVVLGAILMAVLAVLYWDDQRFLKGEPMDELEEDGSFAGSALADVGAEVGLWFLFGL